MAASETPLERILEHYNVDDLNPEFFGDQREDFLSQQQLQLEAWSEAQHRRTASQRNRYSVLQPGASHQTQRIKLVPNLDDVDPLNLNHDITDFLQSIEDNQVSKYLLSSRSFSADDYARDLYKRTQPHFLESGLENLQGSIEYSNGHLMALVKQEFDRYVQAKDTIDTVCSTMKLE